MLTAEQKTRVFERSSLIENNDTPTNAEVCYDRFGSIRKAKTRFFLEILRHGQDDNITGQSYIDFYIKEAA